MEQPDLEQIFPEDQEKLYWHKFHHNNIEHTQCQLIEIIYNTQNKQRQIN